LKQSKQGIATSPTFEILHNETHRLESLYRRTLADLGELKNPSSSPPSTANAETEILSGLSKQHCRQKSQTWHVTPQCARNPLAMATQLTTVNVSLTPELDAFLKSRVESGRYQTTSEVVREALRLLERQEQERDDSLKQLKQKLDLGAAQAGGGDLLDGDAVFAELLEMIEERRRSKTQNQ